MASPRKCLFITSINRPGCMGRRLGAKKELLYMEKTKKMKEVERDSLLEDVRDHGLCCHHDRLRVGILTCDTDSGSGVSYFSSSDNFSSSCFYMYRLGGSHL